MLEGRNVYKIFFLIKLLFIFFGFNSTLFASKTEILFAPNSEHLSSKGEPNEDNNVIGIQYNNWGFATFVNSHHERAWAVSYDWLKKDWRLSENWTLSAKLPLGVAYGYNNDKVDNYEGFVIFAYAIGAIERDFMDKYSIGVVGLGLPTDDGGAVLLGLKVGMKF